MRAKRKVAAAAGAAVVLVGAGTVAYAASSLPTIERSAKGNVDEFNGATRNRGDQTSTIKAAIQGGKAKNVILIIGDGMGDSEITSARNYLLGAGGAFKGLDALPLTGQMTHYSVDKATGKPDYTPDSAATGTAWATGVKSYDGAIGVDRTGTPYTSMLKLAKSKGKATGNVTTSEIQDATPAVQVASVTSRSCYGPDVTSTTCATNAKENGGAGSISEQLLDTRPDVTFGGGSATFAQKAKAGAYKGLTLQQQAKKRGYNYITTGEGLSATSRADQKKPVLGLFDKGNFPTWFGPQVAVAGGANGPAKSCVEDPNFANVPSLKKMTSKAINLLSKNQAGKKNGFFLQVESASIDKKDHGADACGQIGEVGQLDQAVQTALSFAKKNGNTLVIVTADHAHTSQIVDGNTPGLTTKLRTREGSDMIINYATSPAGGSQQHTGTQVRVAGYGPGAANVVGLIDQTDLHFIVRRAMGVPANQ